MVSAHHLGAYETLGMINSLVRSLPLYVTTNRSYLVLHLAGHLQKSSRQRAARLTSSGRYAIGCTRQRVAFQPSTSICQTDRTQSVPRTLTWVTTIPDDQELLQAVTQAGWLLEQAAVRTLDRADCHPRAGWAFEDPDEPASSRELDVWGYRQFLRDESTKVQVATIFLVECKQTSMPYAAIGQVLPDWQVRRNPTQHSLFINQLPIERSGHVTRYEDSWKALGLADISRKHGDSGFRATQLTRLERVKGGDWSASNSGIFTSLVYPLAKAIRAAQKDHKVIDHLALAPVGRKERTDWLSLNLIFPVILISSPVLVLDATNEQPVISRPLWVTARRNLESKTIKGAFDFDVVLGSAFDKYVEDRLNLVREIASLVEADPRRYTGESWSIPTVN
jgi:hypothetical protein